MPTYLPWLGAGEAVPAPGRDARTDEGGSSAVLDWRNPHWQTDIPPYYVQLGSHTEPNLAAPGDPVAVTIEGSDPGELYEGKTPGEVSIYWAVPNRTSCSTVALELVAPDMTRSRARTETVRIAASLRPAP
ncbi:MAG: hypothetical protein E6G44_12175 [Actinobacteria bacterium]|nr:MAG: hypothetical protein E6G44_12175 [Actinomycetota bacterium]